MSSPNLATPLIQPYIDRLASVSPTPGGGSAAAVSGAIATALLDMVANLSLNTADEEATEILNELVPIFGRAREMLIDLGGEDETAYGGYRAALALPKGTAPEKAARKGALQDAILHSTAVPLQTAELALELMQLVPALGECSSPHLEGDITVATALLGACINGSIALVNVNLPTIKDQDAQDEIAERVETLLNTFADIIESDWAELEDEEDDDENEAR
ncbi:MAG: cyclodeaminase/cyclohydrolase family protein [Thermomicrobiales bacterium]|nr:cyclodeaminase/cyclohydrolase family protein [Thermomicrobiales bacterium]